MNRTRFRTVVPVLLSAAIGFLSPGLVLSSTDPDQAEQVFALPELEAPRQIVVAKGRAYISDKREIFVYDLSSGALKSRIGKIGQGPGEFKFMPGRMAAYGDRLVVADFPNLLSFSFDGTFQGQITFPRLLSPYPFLPVGGNYVGFPMEFKEDGSTSMPEGRIFGSDLKPLKAFYGDLPAGPPPPPPPGSAAPAAKSDVLLIRDYGEIAVEDDKIYVADSRKGLVISIFDANGALLREIRHPWEKVKVPSSFADGIVKEWKASPYWGSIYSHKNPVVPEHFPAFFSFKVDGGRIYAVTPRQRDGLSEVVVMNLEGKTLSRDFRFPLAPNFETAFLNGLKYDIEGGRLIWFAYNDQKEIYEMHIR